MQQYPHSVVISTRYTEKLQCSISSNELSSSSCVQCSVTVDKSLPVSRSYNVNVNLQR